MLLLVWTLWLGCAGESTPPPPIPEPAPPASSTDAAEPSAGPAPLADPTEQRYAATHILVAHAGAVGASSTVTRSHAEALQLAESLRERALAGEDFHALAREHSDGPSAPRGGELGTYLTGTMVPAFERAVASVAPGEIAPLAETPFGVHVVRRDAVVRVHVAHLLVSHAKAHQPLSTRNKEEAQARVNEALTKVEAGSDFASVVAELGDRDGAGPGGDLGWISKGQMIPAFEEAAFSLEPGATSKVVETPYGFHLLKRLE